MFEMGRYDRLEGLASDYGTKTFMSVLWAEHMIKEPDPLAAFLNKMKTNIIDETHLEKLGQASLEWEKKLNESHPEVEDSALIIKELFYSIRLLRALWKANRALNPEVATPSRLQAITEATNELSEYRLLHKKAWLARNKQGGFDKSYRRLENLMQLLDLLAHNLSEVKNDRTE
jgi:hypothetical protein